MFWGSGWAFGETPCHAQGDALNLALGQQGGKMQRVRGSMAQDLWDALTVLCSEIASRQYRRERPNTGLLCKPVTVALLR